MNADRSPERIEADIEARRKRLATTLDEISVRTHPSTIKANAQEQAAAAVDRTAGRAFARATEVASAVSGRVRREFVDGYGTPRMERVVPAALVAVAVVGLVVWRRRK